MKNLQVRFTSTAKELKIDLKTESQKQEFKLFETLWSNNSE